MFPFHYLLTQTKGVKRDGMTFVVMILVITIMVIKIVVVIVVTVTDQCDTAVFSQCVDRRRNTVSVFKNLGRDQTQSSRVM